MLSTDSPSVRQLAFGLRVRKRMNVNRCQNPVETVFPSGLISLSRWEKILDERKQPTTEFGCLFLR